MITQLEIKKDGEKYITLTNHSIRDVFFDSFKETDLSPQLHSIARNIVIDGLINTDLVDKEPVPLLDDYGEPMFDDDGNQQFDKPELDSVRELAIWALVPEYCEPYCDVSIALSDSSGELVKREEYEDMFVVEYEDTFDDEHGNGTFTLHLREREIV